MILRYGSYSHALGETDVSIRRTQRTSENNIRIGWTEIWTIRGMVFGNDASALNAAIIALKNAYAFDGQNVALLRNDGSATPDFMISSASETGVLVKEGPSFPVGTGAEHTTFRTYEIVLEAEFGVDPQGGSGDDNTYVFVETISTRGNGGPIRAVLQGQQRAQIQTVAQSSPYYATQSGMAVGKSRWPQPPPPLWPDSLQNPDVAISRKSPNRGGPPGFPTLTDFEVSWDYQFASTSPLTGNPTPPPF